MKAKKQKRCWSCKHRTQGFKVGKLTHYHCMSPTYQKLHKDGDAANPYETLRVFSETCDEHEFRQPMNQEKMIEKVINAIDEELQQTDASGSLAPHRCPVCNGSGLVPNGFYMQTSGHWSTSSITPEQCRSCNGAGIVCG